MLPRAAAGRQEQDVIFSRRPGAVPAASPLSAGLVLLSRRGIAEGDLGSPATRPARCISARHGIVYTRYADALTFSAGPGFRDKVGYRIARVRHIAGDEGFAVNPKKTRVRRPGSRQAVTGLVVNTAPAVPRDVVRRVRAILHRAKTEGLAAQNRDGDPNFRGWVEGMIAYIAMAKPEVDKALGAALAEVADR